MNIGILTYHRSHNYGAFLQAYSLSHALDKLEGINCELINYNLKKEDNVFKKRKYKRPIYLFQYLKQDIMFDKQQSRQLLSDPLILDDEYESTLRDAEKKYDVVIVGSDEIWRIASRGFPNIYWLPGKYNFVKMSYAASGRMDVEKLPKETREKLGELYADFAYIGVRDFATKLMVEKTSDNKVTAKMNCDPAFLYDRYGNKEKLRHKICQKWHLNEDRKIVAVMYDRPEAITKLRKFLGKDYQFICIARPMWNADKNLCYIKPFEWADVIGGSDFLLSSYYHGMLFALNQNTPFLTIDRRSNREKIQTSKLYDFLKNANLEDRYYLSCEMKEEIWEKIAQRVRIETDNADTDFSNVVKEQKKLFEEFLKTLRTVR